MMMMMMMIRVGRNHDFFKNQKIGFFFDLNQIFLKLSWKFYYQL